MQFFFNDVAVDIIMLEIIYIFEYLLLTVYPVLYLYETPTRFFNANFVIKTGR